MFSRQDYVGGKCSHRQYYAQFVSQASKDLVRESFGLEKLREANAKCWALNLIPLHRWDRLPQAYDHNLVDQIEGGWSMGAHVCILKEAARQVVEWAF